MTVIQRFGGGLNLNIHFHTLLFDGVLNVDHLDFPGGPTNCATMGGRGWSAP